MSASTHVWSPQLSICLFVPSVELARLVLSSLLDDHYLVVELHAAEELVEYVAQHKHQLDCMILEQCPALTPLAHQLQQRAIAIPTLIIRPADGSPEEETPGSPSPPTETEMQENYLVRSTEVQVRPRQLHLIRGYIDKAISQFITQAVTTRLSDESSPTDTPSELTNFIVRQQRRLADKLHERLGYLGVYYKRNPQNFLRNLPMADRQEFLDQLKSKYRQIVLSYFSNDRNLNSKIDEYVNMAFFADVPVTRVVEIHMELMDNFSKQLKLEGRSEDVLLDYRLTLIDTLAHLCEMYRRSIPQETR